MGLGVERNILFHITQGCQLIIRTCIFNDTTEPAIVLSRESLFSEDMHIQIKSALKVSFVEFSRSFLCSGRESGGGGGARGARGTEQPVVYNHWT